MGAAIGAPPPDVMLLGELRQALESSPGSFEFFQAVRLLDQAGAKLRFHANAGLAFPAGDMHEISLAGHTAEIAVNFLGLVGPMGVLPYAYSELVADRARAKDHALGEFFDIFHQRLLELFYAAWRKHRFPVPWEQQHDDGVTSALRAVLGLRTGGLEDRQQVADTVLMFHAGLLGLQSRPAEALRQMLESHLRVPVEIVQFCGAWSMLPPEHQCRLGSESISEQLGMGTILGEAVWDQQSCARLRLGPMPLARYRELMPGRPAFREVEALAAFFSQRQHSFEIQLVLDREEVPALSLGEDLPLGWCSWLNEDGHVFAAHPDDALLPLED